MRVRLEADVRNGAPRAVARRAGFVEQGVERADGFDVVVYSTEIDTLLG